MKKMFFFLLLLPFMLSAQGDAPTNNMFENLVITPVQGKVEDLRTNMAAHNKKYHNEGPYHANVFQVMAGPNTGKMIWSMGPCNFSHMDGHPNDPEHSQDWRTNVMPFIEHLEHGGFWSQNVDLSYWPEGMNFQKLRIRIIDIKRGEAYRFRQLMGNVREVYAKKEYKRAHVVYSRRLASTDGRDMVSLFGYESWSALDGSGLEKDYEEVHGEGSWDLFQEELEECVEGFDDDLWELVVELSGSSGN